MDSKFVILEILTATQLLKEIVAFHGIRGLIGTLAVACGHCVF
jgi:hypothetical protein